jgi:hypothetical protein
MYTTTIIMAPPHGHCQTSISDSIWSSTGTYGRLQKIIKICYIMYRETDGPTSLYRSALRICHCTSCQSRVRAVLLVSSSERRTPVSRWQYGINVADGGGSLLLPDGSFFGTGARVADGGFGVQEDTPGSSGTSGSGDGGISPLSAWPP